jgi:hypothetical protein
LVGFSVLVESALDSVTGRVTLGGTGTLTGKKDLEATVLEGYKVRNEVENVGLHALMLN